MYVVLEGVDGAGKSTQVGLLKDRFKNAFYQRARGDKNRRKFKAYRFK